jgi:nitrogen regulatory protein PII
MSDRPQFSNRTLVTIVCESVLEVRLLKDLATLGAPGWTISDARGRGSRGVRSAGWDTDGNVRIEVVCNRELGERIVQHVQATYYRDFAMICFLGEVAVLRPEKF